MRGTELNPTIPASLDSTLVTGEEETLLGVILDAYFGRVL